VRSNVPFDNLPGVKRFELGVINLFPVTRKLFFKMFRFTTDWNKLKSDNKNIEITNR